MNKYQILIFSILFGLMILASCKNEDINLNIMFNKWKVVKIKKQGESKYSKTKKNYILNFTSDTTYTLHLDVNSCLGVYNIIKNGDITIGPMVCTEMCCDSEFAENLSFLLPKMSDYYGKGDELIFEGQGKIILKQY